MNGFTKAGLVLWGIGLCILLPVFWYTASNPESVLWIEEQQAARGIQRARELVQQGDYRGAIRSTQAAIDFFHELTEKHGQESHRIHLALGYLELAGLYERFGTTTEKQQRAALYRKGIAAYPDVSKGLPYLKLGDLLLEQGAYQESLESYNKVLNYQLAPVALLAYQGMGFCYVHLGQAEKAAEYWYRVLRFSANKPADILQNLPDCISPFCQLLQSYKYWSGNQISKAIPLLESFLEQYPQDPFAIFLYQQSKKQKLPSLNGEIPSDNFFPVALQSPVLIQHTIFDLYSSTEEQYDITLTLSSEFQGDNLPKIKLRNGNQEQEIVVLAQEPQEYEITLTLSAGQNLINLSDPAYLVTHPEYKVFLHKVTVQPLNSPA
ncbi:MAG: tetratricopeptide repeat protein [bacterium]|jgi:tetratricopeptide (TPR) repeat protein